MSINILKMKNQGISVLILAFIFCNLLAGHGQSNDCIADIINYRALGPYRAGSWISAIAVPYGDNPKYKYTFYTAGRNGGVWKTENNGTSFFQVFDSTGASSVGAVAVSSSNPEVIWVGTGDTYNARSSHAGNGVYRSEDGGKTWQHKGLDDTQHISTLIVHPTNPDIVWVAAMGHLFSANQMRGVFKTTDGGTTWEKVLYIDENTGVIDMIIHPQNPDILLAAAYEKYRYPWHYEAGGNKSGMYKSNNGGKNWEKLTGGLPDGKLGRIGLALCYSQPAIIYAVIENLNPKPGTIIDETIGMSHMRDAYFDQMIGGEVYRSGDGGISWEKRNDTTCNVSAKAAYSFNKIMVASDNPEIIYVSSDLMLYSEDGGQTWPDCQWPPQVLSSTIFGDHRTLWMDPDDGRHLMVGSDGGLYESFDRGKSFTHHVQIPLGEIYGVETDNANPYNVYLGLQDHEAWKGPSNSWSGQIGAADWVITGMWDGMYTRVDQQDNRWLYTTTQFGAHLRVDQLRGERTTIEPKEPEGQPPYRYCWVTPIELSPHNPQIIYTGGQMLLRSFDRGENWQELSPDLTTNDAAKIAGKGHMMYCTITTISESPVKAGVIWVGTDDGRVWMTPDGGKSWKESTAAIAKLGGDEELWVSRIIASPHQAGKAYVCKNGYRADDFRPLVFKTENYGQSWQAITNGLPLAPVNVIMEDPHREGLLYLGNDKEICISFDDGEKWDSFKNNMPTVPVKDLKIHPEAGDLIVGTYGRGAYIADIWPLQVYNDSIMRHKNFLFPIQPKPQRNYSERAWWGNYEQTGDNHFVVPNAPNGLALYYYRNQNPTDSSWIKISDIDSNVIDKLLIDQQPGFHLHWYDTWQTPPGTYRVQLITGEKIQEQKAIVKPSPLWPVGRMVWEK
jgi:photosystem II stability/assembly factor-like uncharacterized protein